MSAIPTELKNLRKKIDYHYKPQTCNFGKAIIVKYVDARDVQDLLDEVVGPENWKNDYKVINGNLYSGLSIKVDNEWVTKWDCGISADHEVEKSEASDAFKRSAVQWGIGRFLYRGPKIVLKTAVSSKGKEMPATNEGKILWNPEALNNYIKSIGEDKLSGSRNAGTKTIKKKISKNKDYKKVTKEPVYKNPESNKYSDETIKRVKETTHNEKSGKECLKEHIEDFCKSKNYNFKKISELDDSKMNELVDYINNITPENL